MDTPVRKCRLTPIFPIFPDWYVRAPKP
jgi:hypothetical protein